MDSEVGDVIVLALVLLVGGQGDLLTQVTEHTQVNIVISTHLNLGGQVVCQYCMGRDQVLDLVLHTVRDSKCREGT